MKVFYITITEDTGIEAISLVEKPAMEKDFLCFKEEPMKLSFNSSEHIITGVICLADTPIYRFSPQYGDYYVVFSKEAIKQMVQKFAKQGLFNVVNLQHDENKFVDDIFMFESYLVDYDRGICPNSFGDLPEGSWVASYKVENEDLWEEIVQGKELNGFSLEGIFNLEEKFNSQQELTFDDWLKQFFV